MTPLQLKVTRWAIVCSPSEGPDTFLTSPSVGGDPCLFGTQSLALSECEWQSRTEWTLSRQKFHPVSVSVTVTEIEEAKKETT